MVLECPVSCEWIPAPVSPLVASCSGLLRLYLQQAIKRARQRICFPSTKCYSVCYRDCVCVQIEQDTQRYATKHECCLSAARWMLQQSNSSLSQEQVIISSRIRSLLGDEFSVRGASWERALAFCQLKSGAICFTFLSPPPPRPSVFCVSPRLDVL